MSEGSSDIDPAHGGTSGPRHDRLTDAVERLIAAEHAASLAGPHAIRWRAELIAAGDNAVTEVGLDEFLEQALEAVRELLEADTVSFLAANESGDELLARTSVGMAERVSLGVKIPAGSGMAGRVIATRQPLIVDDLSSIELASPLLREVGVKSVVAVPVHSEDRVMGVLHAGSFSLANFGEADVAVLTIIADRLATAMDRVRLFQSERDARARAEVLARRLAHVQRVTDALSGDPTPDEVAEIVCTETTVFLGSGIAGCALWEQLDGSLSLVHPEMVFTSARPFSRVGPDEHHPAADAARSAEPVWIESAEALLEQYPGFSEVRRSHNRFAYLPLVGSGRVSGVLALGFDAEGAFDDAERHFLGSLAAQTAQAFDRARLRQLERRLISDSGFLAELSAALGESLDFDSTLHKAVRLIVPEVADLATIHLFEASGRLIRAALAHRDPDVEAAIWESSPVEDHPAVTEALVSIARGQTVHVPDLQYAVTQSTGGMAGLTLRDQLTAALAPLHITSAIVAPLSDNGVGLGVLTLAQVSHQRAFDDADRSLADEVARRAAMAIANSRLHSTLRDAQRAERFLLDVATGIAHASDFEETLQHLAATAVPPLGDLCLIDLVDDNGDLQRLVAHHDDPSMQPYVDQLRENPPDISGEHPSARAVRERRALWSTHMAPDFLEQTTRNEQHLDLVRLLSFTSYMAVPLTVNGDVLGSLTLVAAGSGRTFNESDVALAERLASQVAAVVAKARRYDREHRISHLLQTSLLPELPALANLELAVRYLPGTLDAEVGGDFYDSVALPDGSVGLVIGDVAGHDHGAAAIMGQLRAAIRTLAAGGLGPAEIVQTLQQTWDVLGYSRMATALIARLDPSTGTLSVANAGHPRPLVVASETASYLPVPVGPPLGAPGAEVNIWNGSIRLGETLLLYTDGIYDDRERDLGELIAELAAHAASGPTDVGALCDWILAATGSDRSDDLALLAVARVATADG